MARIALVEKSEYTQIIRTDASGRSARIGSIRPRYTADGTARHLVTSYVTRERYTVAAERDVAIAEVVGLAS